MSGFFDPDNKLFSFLSSVTSLIVLNFFCILLCLPIVTAGASITAMYYVALKMADGDDPYVIRNFFKSFRENFKQATLMWLGILFTVLLIYFDINLVASGFGDSLLSTALQIGIGIITALIVITVLYLFPMLSKFENTTRNTIINAFITAVSHLPSTLLLLVMQAFPFALLLLSPQIGIFIDAFLGFSFTAFVCSMIYNRIFKKYIPEEAEIPIS